MTKTAVMAPIEFVTVEVVYSEVKKLKSRGFQMGSKWYEALECLAIDHGGDTADLKCIEHEIQ